MSRDYGVLLPHFGEHASRRRIIDGAVLVEQLGFDSLWVRDHVVFSPHGHEGSDRTFVEPIAALSAAAAVTERIKLATGCLIPHRHPIHAAQGLASLDFLAGGDRVIVGLGLGSFAHEFAAVGMDGWDRRKVLEEQVAIWRKLWAGGAVDHEGEFYSFTDVVTEPTPQKGDLPIWYSGTSPASVRRAVEYCDGWIPGRMPRPAYRKLMTRMARLADEAGKELPRAGVIPSVSPGRTMEAATASLDIGGILEEVSHRYEPPTAAGFRSLDDLDGAVIAGPPERIVEEVRAFEREGASHVVFDLRLRHQDWEDCVRLLGEEVLPALKDGRHGEGERHGAA